MTPGNTRLAAAKQPHGTGCRDVIAVVRDDNAVPGGQLRDVVAAGQGLQGDDIDGAALTACLRCEFRHSGERAARSQNRHRKNRGAKGIQTPIFCMPCSTIPSEDVGLGPVPADHHPAAAANWPVMPAGSAARSARGRMKWCTLSYRSVAGPTAIGDGPTGSSPW